MKFVAMYVDVGKIISNLVKCHKCATRVRGYVFYLILCK